MELKITNKSKIDIVIGYSKKITLRFSEDEIVAVNKVFFVCKALDICVEMQKENNDFVTVIDYTTTSLFTPIITYYNFNIEYNEASLKGGYNAGELEVFENKNPTTCNSNVEV